MNLTPQKLQIAFRNSDFVRHFFYYPAIGSTNDKAKELAAGGAEEGTLVIADAQTAGRGRLDRNWFSPPGLGLYMSFVLRPGVAPDRSAGSLMAVSLAAAEAVEELGIQGVVGIKWPNDLVAEHRKVAGVLSEIGVSGGKVDWCVVGIGINVNHTLADFPVELRDKATSLRELCHRRIDRLDLMKSLIAGVSRWNGRFTRDGLEPLIAQWRRRSAILGKRVRVETSGEVVVGTAVGLEPDGALRVKLESGAEEVLHVGDVHLVQYR